ncbi:MAG: ribosome biogenesis GTP-binding protein YihA/YsxC [Coxiellaceae bacterium]|nr:ribosome biogenesis GTP-binding protein YihA/YsxC [Coxiellaceae bacterium]
MLLFEKAIYVTSATKLAELPSDCGVEVAFIGRSNAGKSSAINAITRVNGLARTSSTPGRTQMINFFQIDENHRLVDLPGYGFAKTTLANRARWDQMISDYFEKRESLAGLVLLMDVRHPLKPHDQEMIAWCVEFEVPVHILLSKADKLSKDAQKKALFLVQKSVSHCEGVSVQLFSAPKKMGVDEARLKLDAWLRQ